MMMLRRPSPTIRHQAQQPADHRGEQDRAQPDEQRDARAVEDPRQQVPPELVGAERMARRARRLQALREVAGDGVVRGEQRGGQRGGEGGRHQTQTPQPEAVPPHQRHAPLSRRVRGSSQP
jgi:hypothetical protein